MIRGRITRIEEFLNNNEKRMLLFLTAFTFVLRLIFTFVSYSKQGATQTDTEYIYWGVQFAQGHWVNPTEITSKMIVAPYLPLLVTLFIKLFSDFAFPIYLYNALLTTLVVPVLYLLGKELFSKKVAWFICIWGIFFPEFFKYTPFVLKESTLFFVLPLMILMLIRSIKQPQKLRFIVYAALSFTILIHTDERFVIYLPVFALIFLLVKPLKFLTVLKSWAIWFGIIVILSLPWSVRNYLVYDQIVILSPRTTAFTSHFWGDKLTHLEYFSYDDALNSNKEKYAKQTNEFEELYSITPKEYNNKEVKIRAFLNYWQPSYFKPTYITYGYRPQKWSFRHNMESILFYGIFLPFYIVGLFLLIKKKYLLGIFLATIPLIHSILHAYMVSPLERYRSPITFIVVIISFWALTYIFRMKNQSEVKVV